MTRKLITIAIPKGRIAQELRPLLAQAGITPHESFDDPSWRGLQFATSHPNVQLIRVRAFDVATFVAFGAAQLGIVGQDVLMEHLYDSLYAPLPLDIGKCRLSVAAPRDLANQLSLKKWSHIRVATKYPRLTHNYYATKGVHAECISLHGAMELAPNLGLCERIVDLVSTGKTLEANGLVEIETIAHIRSCVIVNRIATKTMTDTVGALLKNLEQICNAKDISLPA